MASVDRSNFINVRMISAVIMYDNFINKVIQNHNGDLSILDDLSLNVLENQENDFNIIFLDLLIANISILLPILLNEYLDKANIEELFNKYGEFFKERKSDYSYFKNKKGKIIYETRHSSDLRKAVSHSLNKFRNALEHGLYEITYDNKDAYIRYKYEKGKNDFVYKKVPLSIVISIMSEMFDYNYSNNLVNRLSFGILNNMKLIYQQLKSKHNFKYHYKLLEGNLLNEDDVNYFEDMKYASSFLAFYVYYQKHLEIALGPMLSDYNSRNGENGKDISMISSDILNKFYFDLSTLDLGELEDTVLVNVDVLDFETMLARYEDYINRAIYFINNDTKISDLEKSNMLNVIVARKEFLFKYKNKLNVLHHIRNAFAHGRVNIIDEHIHIIDKDRTGNVTYENVVSIDEFKILLNKNNLSLISVFLRENSNFKRNC